MKIIFLNRFFFPDHSATSQMLSDLAFFLSDRDYDVHIITSRLRYDDPDARLCAREQIQKVEVHRVWTSRFGRHFLPGRVIDYLTFYLSAAYHLFRLARAGDIVIAKTDPPLISVVAGWVARLRKARLVNWLQDLFPEVAVALEVKGFDGWLGKWLRHERNRSLLQAEINVVLGERMQGRLVNEGVSADRVQIIHNWADGEAIKPIESACLQEDEDREANKKKAWGLEGKFVVGYSGNLGRAHEFQTLLGAAEALKGDRDIVFLFIGGGAQVELVQKEGEKRGLENLQFKPYQPREVLCQSLSVPDVHVIVLRPELEGLIVPSKFYGIAAAGRPSLFIGDLDGEIPKILRASQAGVAVEVADVEGLVKQLLWMKENREELQSMGGNARVVFDSRFSKMAAFKRWEEVVKSVGFGRAIN